MDPSSSSSSSSGNGGRGPPERERVTSHGKKSKNSKSASRVQQGVRGSEKEENAVSTDDDRLSGWTIEQIRRHDDKLQADAAAASSKIDKNNNNKNNNNVASSHTIAPTRSSEDSGDDYLSRFTARQVQRHDEKQKRGRRGNQHGNENDKSNDDQLPGAVAITPKPATNRHMDSDDDDEVEAPVSGTSSSRSRRRERIRRAQHGDESSGHQNADGAESGSRSAGSNEGDRGQNTTAIRTSSRDTRELVGLEQSNMQDENQPVVAAQLSEDMIKQQVEERVQEELRIERQRQQEEQQFMVSANEQMKPSDLVVASAVLIDDDISKQSSPSRRTKRKRLGILLLLLAAFFVCIAVAIFFATTKTREKRRTIPPTESPSMPPTSSAFVLPPTNDDFQYLVKLLETYRNITIFSWTNETVDIYDDESELGIEDQGTNFDYEFYHSPQFAALVWMSAFDDYTKLNFLDVIKTLVPPQFTSPANQAFNASTTSNQTFNASTSEISSITRSTDNAQLSTTEREIQLHGLLDGLVVRYVAAVFYYSTNDGGRFQGQLSSILVPQNPELVLGTERFDKSHVPVQSWRVSWKNQMQFLDPTKDVCDWNDPSFRIDYDWPSGIHCSSSQESTVNMDDSLGFGRGLTLHITIGKNGLHGTLPTELVLLAPFMTELAIVENQLIGTIPNALGRGSNQRQSLLTRLDLHDNYLTGTIPSDLFFFENKLLTTVATNLQYIRLETNYLHGTLPTAPVPNATNLSLFTSNNDSRQHSVLELLSLSQNDLSGSIPSEWGFWFGQSVSLARGVSVLEKLYLQQNRLSGSLPSELAQITSLSELLLFGNVAIQGSIPLSYFTELDDLEELSIVDTSITGDLDNILCNRNYTGFADASVLPSDVSVTIQCGSFFVDCFCCACEVSAYQDIRLRPTSAPTSMGGLFADQGSPEAESTIAIDSSSTRRQGLRPIKVICSLLIAAILTI